MRIFFLRKGAYFVSEKTTSVLVTTLIIASLFPFSIPVSPVEVHAETGVIIPYLATEYKFKVVEFGAEPDFQQIGYNESEFFVGNAGFGTQAGYCPLNNAENAKTPWPLNTDILLRKEFNLPAGVSDLQVAVAIDNDVQVFVNGQDISGGLVLHEDCPTRDSFVFGAPQSILIEGENLLAIRARDRGELSYVDVQVTAVTGGQGPRYDLVLFEGTSPSDGVIGFCADVRALATVQNDPVASQVDFTWETEEGFIGQSSTHSVSSGQAEDTASCLDPGRWFVEADFGNGQVIQRTLFVGFMVLPESPIGPIAMILSSVGVLGGFLYFRSRKTSINI
jgi:hypothetical protein